MKKHKIYFSDLKKLFKQSIIILANHEDIIPKPDIYEKGFIYPHVGVIYPEKDIILSTIIILKNRIDSIDDFCLTLLHELIHLWLYTKDIYDHDEKYIEEQAKIIYEYDKKAVIRFVKNKFPYIIKLMEDK